MISSECQFERLLQTEAGKGGLTHQNRIVRMRKYLAAAEGSELVSSLHVVQVSNGQHQQEGIIKGLSTLRLDVPVVVVVVEKLLACLMCDASMTAKEDLRWQSRKAVGRKTTHSPGSTVCDYAGSFTTPTLCGQVGLEAL
jgi:hypothetical protein